MTDETNNLGDGLEIQDNQEGTSTTQERTDSTQSNTSDNQEGVGEDNASSEAKPNKIKAIIAQVTDKIQPLIQHIKDNKP